MPCYHPMQAWHGKTKNASGKRSLVFSKVDALQPDDPQDISCGQCVGCRLERSRQWATRCLHEASLYTENCFITLTFSDMGLQQREHEYKFTNLKRQLKEKEPLDVPQKQSIHTRDFQLFMKRLRKKNGANIRFFQCGEYGDEKRRPHYHACLFNFEFTDKQYLKLTDQGHKLYHSERLAELWPYGFNTIGEVNFETAAYVARYVMKKVNGPKQEKHYQEIDWEKKEIINIKPEYTTMSRRPGIGFEWFRKYNKEVYDNDYVVINGKKVRAPKYYDNQLQIADPFHYDEIKEDRLNNKNNNNIDNTPERLEIREKVRKLKLKQLVRNHDQPER